MIVCPNCNHQNPDGAVQCEACYTPLPATMSCPNCSATVQTDASFCGQCGYNLRTAASTSPAASVSPDLVPSVEVATSPPEPVVQSEAAVQSPPLPDLLPLDPLVPPDPLIVEPSSAPMAVSPAASPDPPSESIPLSAVSQPAVSSEEAVLPAVVQSGSSTQLQQQTARLLHLQTNASLELPQSLTVVHLGKPNDRIPPDIDVSGFPDSEIVSRIHADIRIEGDAYYVEDVGSSNGTYINNVPLPMGNRHRLRPGDRISLGKGDKVTFLFQLS